MNHYNAVTNNELDDNYLDSRNKFNIKILFNRYILRKNVGDAEGNGEPRVIHINDSLANSSFGYSDNHISTTKYNFATFLPKFLFQEFSKYANLFFYVHLPFNRCLTSRQLIDTPQLVLY